MSEEQRVNKARRSLAERGTIAEGSAAGLAASWDWLTASVEA